MMSPGQLAFDGGHPILAPGHPSSWASASSGPEPPPPPLGLHRQVFGPPLSPEAQGPEALARSTAGIRDSAVRTVGRLERRWEDMTGRLHGVACRSGQAALQMAVACLGLEPGDEVVVPVDAPDRARTLAADGLVPVPVDLDPRTFQLDPASVVGALTPRTQAVLAVNRFGTMVDYGALEAVRSRTGVALVEDVSESLGAAHRRRPAGSLGDVSVCALAGDDPNSVLGASGLLATDDEKIAATARQSLLIDGDIRTPQGCHSTAVELGGPAGWAVRLSELDAAVGNALLRRIEDEAAARTANGLHLQALLSTIPGVWAPPGPRGSSHVFTMMPLVMVPDELGLTESMGSVLRDTVADILVAEGLEVEPWPNQLWPAAWPRPEVGEPDAFPVAHHLHEVGLVLGRYQSPFAPASDLAVMASIADCVAKVFVDHLDRLRQLTLERAAIR